MNIKSKFKINFLFAAIIGDNAIPLPPRDRTRSLLVGKPRHERKYPLIIPTAIAQALSQHSVSIAKNNGW